MKVLHLGKFCPPKEGGIEVFSYDLIEALNKKGIKADLLCFDECTEESFYNNFKYFACKTDIVLNSAPLSYDYIKTFLKIHKKYDIIHIHSPNPLAEIASLWIDKKIIVHWHSDIVKQKITYLFYRPFQQMVLQKSKIIIATSPQYLEASTQIKNYKSKAVVVPLGLNPERLKNENNNVLELEKIKDKIEGKKVVLSIGRLVEYKGFAYLIEAARFLKDDIVILIAGSGPLYNTLKTKLNP
jgi:Glycosyltransferase